MQQKQDQKTPAEQISLRGTFYVLHVLARAHSTCFTVFTRHTFGQEALGWNGLLAFLLIPVYGGLANAPLMFPFWGVWFLALIAQRLRTTWAVLNGWKIHSRFRGHLWLGFLLPFVNSYRAAVVVEMLSVFAAGMFLRRWSEPVGKFMMVGSLSLLIVYVIERWALIMDARRMIDAELEMEVRTEIYRGNFTDF